MSPELSIPCSWVLHDGRDGVLRETESFESKEAAEAWMGSEWAALLAEGAEEVSLVEDLTGKVIYRMGLRET